MKNILVIAIVALCTCACTPKAKEKIGLTTPGPDENQVIKNKNLELPPHYTLSELPVPEEYKKLQKIDEEENSSKGKKKSLFSKKK